MKKLLFSCLFVGLAGFMTTGCSDDDSSALANGAACTSDLQCLSGYCDLSSASSGLTYDEGEAKDLGCFTGCASSCGEEDTACQEACAVQCYDSCDEFCSDICFGVAECESSCIADCPITGGGSTGGGSTGGETGGGTGGETGGGTGGETGGGTGGGTAAQGVCAPNPNGGGTSGGGTDAGGGGTGGGGTGGGGTGGGGTGGGGTGGGGGGSTDVTGLVARGTNFCNTLQACPGMAGMECEVPSESDVTDAADPVACVAAGNAFYDCIEAQDVCDFMNAFATCRTQSEAVDAACAPAGGGGGGGGESCTNTCEDADDGFCDDGGPGSATSICDLGTDCNDCGPR